jgi:hypothetical protein
VYFNNDWEAFVPRNASWLRSRLLELAVESAENAQASAPAGST